MTMTIFFGILSILLIYILIKTGEEVWIFALLPFLLCAIASLCIEGAFVYNKYSGAKCMLVKDGSEVLYKGNGAFYITESRGTQMYFREVEQVAWFPKTLQERISDKITAIQLKDCKNN